MRVLAGRRTPPAWVLILLLGALVWSGSLENGFHYDDEHSILLNIHLRARPEAASLAQHVAAFFSDPATFSRDADKGMYRPLLVTTLAVNYAANLWLGLNGYDVRLFHVVNILLHLGNALLLYWLARCLWPGAGGRGLGLVAGMLFVAWPLASEPVNYISSRSESLAALFYLLALVLFATAHRDDGQARRWRLAVWGAMAAGLASKSTLITLPAALLLFDVALVSRFDWKRLRRRLLIWHVPGWAVVGAYLALIVDNRFLTRSLAVPVRDGWTQLLTQLKAIGYYLHLLVMPTRLSVEPQFGEQVCVSAAVVAGVAIGISLALGLAWLAWRRQGRALTLLGIAVLHMLPTMVMPLNVFVNERRAYLPAALLCLGVVALVAHAGLRLRLRALATAVLVIAAALSLQRNQVWADDLSLWTEASRRAPLMARTHLYLGNAYKDRALRSVDDHERSSLWQQAADAYERALTLRGDADLRVRALNNLGGVHFERGDFPAAEAAFRRAVESSEGYADALINLGNALLQRSRQAPDAGEARRLLQESCRWYRRGLEAEPNNYFGHGNLGVALQELGRRDEAETAFRRALYLQPDHDGTLTNLAALLLARATETTDAGHRQRLLREARQLVRHALRLNPGQARARSVAQIIEARLRRAGPR